MAGVEQEHVPLAFFRTHCGGELKGQHRSTVRSRKWWGHEMPCDYIGTGLGLVDDSGSPMLGDWLCAEEEVCLDCELVLRRTLGDDCTNRRARL